MELNIHSHLAIQVLKRPSLSLWYLCRAADYKDGSGKVIVTRQQIEEECNVTSRTTLWRFLNDKDLIRHYYYSRELNAYVVYYRGLVEVCKRLGVESLGGIGQSDTVKNLAVQAANIEAIKRQRMSQYMAKQSSEGWSMIEPEQYFDTEGTPLSSLSKGSKTARACKFRDYTKVYGRNIMIIKSSCQTYGASQQGIADSLDISINTLRSLLKDVPKIQVAQYVSQDYYGRALFESAQRGGSPIEKGFVVTQKGVIKMLPYRYYPLYALSSQKDLRSKVCKETSNP